MTKHILKCLEHGYMLEKICPKCNQETILPRPPKFSLQDKYGEYRRDVKKKDLKEKGLY